MPVGKKMSGFSFSSSWRALRRRRAFLLMCLGSGAIAEMVIMSELCIIMNMKPIPPASKSFMADLHRNIKCDKRSATSKHSRSRVKQFKKNVTDLACLAGFMPGSALTCFRRQISSRLHRPWPSSCRSRSGTSRRCTHSWWVRLFCSTIELQPYDSASRTCLVVENLIII